MTRTVDDLPDGATVDVPAEFIFVEASTRALAWMGQGAAHIPVMMLTVEGRHADGKPAEPVTLLMNVHTLAPIIGQLVTGLAEAYDHHGPPSGHD